MIELTNRGVVAGDKRSIKFKVFESDTAQFMTEVIHPFYSTFALGRDIEWTCRQFVLDIKELDEEGIGTFLNIEHLSPALHGEDVIITATVSLIEKNVLNCIFEAKVKDRMIAKGSQGQKVIAKSRVEEIIKALKNG